MKRILTFALFALILALMAGCSKDTGSGVNAPPSKGPAQALTDMSKSGVFNFNEVNSLYQEQLLKAQAGDPEAMVYASLLGFAELANDPTMDSIMVWSGGGSKEAFDLNSVGLTFGGKSAAKGMALKQSAFLRSMPARQAGLSNKLARTTLPGYPEISEVQEILEARLLPILDRGITFLTQLSARTDFNMVVEVDQDKYEIDQTEVRALLAIFYELKIYSVILISYSFDFDESGSYEYLNVDSMTSDVADKLIALADQSNGSFLRVRGGQQALLNQNPDNMLAAIAAARSALEFCHAENGDQTYDIITRDMLGTEAGYDSLLKQCDTLNLIYSKTQAYAYQYYDSTVYVQASNMFTVPDFKAFLPYYEIFPYSEWEVAPAKHQWTDSSCNSYWDGVAYTQYCYQSMHSNQFPIKFKNEAGTVTVNGAVGMDALDDSLSANLLSLRDLATRVVFKDPTFNNVLPGMTNARLWGLIAYVDSMENLNSYQPAAPPLPATPKSRVYAADPTMLLTKVMK